MAVDQWLLESARAPVLRVYGWESGWGSLGYFVPFADAEAFSPQTRWVRRWTGGGIVDHAADWTYTLVIPGRTGLAGTKGGESYRVIHEALAKALRGLGVDAELSCSSVAARGGDCFTQPVQYDLCDATGRKISGAGQRRSRNGLLHQGSLAGDGDSGLAYGLASALAGQVETVRFVPPQDVVDALVEQRYGSEAWLRRR